MAEVLKLERSAGRDFDSLLRIIVEGTASSTGDDFFRSLVEHLASALDAKIAFVAEFAGSRDRVRTLAFWAFGEIQDNIEYALAGTPCEGVLAGEVKLYSEGVADLFPEEPELRDIGAESYLAIPLYDSDGAVIGHLAAIDDRPMYGGPRDMSVFRIFGTRVATELERQYAEQALRESELTLSTVLGSATDAIVALDQDGRVRLFNAAAERVFGVGSSEVLGNPFERFLSAELQELLAPYQGLGSLAAEEDRQIWIPDGLQALRGDGTAFPIELTLSLASLAEQQLLTLILRDVNDKLEAEQRLAQLGRAVEYLEQEIRAEHNFEDMVSSAPAMRAVFDAIAQIAATDSTALVLGETGVGKELIARAIHNRSERRERPLVKLNCAALPAELIESELFGHEKGAFTGATAQRPGRFELADRGTLFLDEVGELTLAAQAKLLRVLQDQEFERVGGVKPIRVDVRLIAATNRDLAAMVTAGEFRRDLFYRLNVFPIRVPPLRERSEDIPYLVRHFLDQFGRRFGKALEGISPTSLQRLQRYSWPGNIRELQNVIERASIVAATPVVDIPDTMLEFSEAPASALGAKAITTLADAEREHIVRALEATDWVIDGAKGAALMLDINASTLRSRIRKLGIEKP